MPRKGYLDKFLKKIGKGNQMDKQVLKNALLKAVNSSPKALEEHGFKHGTAVRLCRKVKDLNLTKEQLNSMTAKEVHNLYYAKKAKNSSALAVQKIEPDFKLLQEKWNESRIKAQTPSQKKLALNKTTTVELYYYNDETNKELVAKGTHKFYSLSNVLKRWRDYENNKITVTYQRHHEFGGEAEYDFTGVKIPYIQDSVEKFATVIVATLTGSGHIFVKAIENQSLPVVCAAIADSFKYWGGCPNVVRIDNFKAATIKAGRYQGLYTEDFHRLTSFFDVDIYSCRTAMARDKGSVEAVVKYATHYALSIANHRAQNGQPFYSLNEINDFLKPYIEKMNNKKIRGYSKTRQELFDELEKPMLHQPNSWDYLFDESFLYQVPSNGRVLFKNHEYAVNKKWIGETVLVSVTKDTLRISQNSSNIAIYTRKDEQPGLSSKPGITPEPHIYYDIYRIAGEHEILLEWAEHIGAHVKEWCENLLFKNKMVYADKNRIIDKMLSIPKANTRWYKLYNDCIKELMRSSMHNVTCYEIEKKWAKVKRDNLFEEDAVYSSKNFKNMALDYIYGKKSYLSWNNNDVAKASSNTSLNGTNLNAPREFLNGINLYKNRYKSVNKALNS